MDLSLVVVAESFSAPSPVVVIAQWFRAPRTPFYTEGPLGGGDPPCFLIKYSWGIYSGNLGRRRREVSAAEGGGRGHERDGRPQESWCSPAVSGDRGTIS